MSLIASPAAAHAEIHKLAPQGRKTKSAMMPLIHRVEILKPQSTVVKPAITLIDPAVRGRQVGSKDTDRLVVQRLIQPTFLSNPVVKKK